MIKNGVLIDTSLWIEFFKKLSRRSSVVENLILENRVLTTGIVLAELLQGVRNEKEEIKIIDVFGALPAVEMTFDLWRKAGQTASTLRRKGITLPLTDLAISTLGIEYDFSIFTLDHHFKQIPKIKIYNPTLPTEKNSDH